MNGKKAKMARRIAREELANDPTKVADGLVAQRLGKGAMRAINAPFSPRSLTQAIKKEYKKSQRGAA